MEVLPPSSPKEPSPKKLKMSSTTTTSDDENRDTAAAGERKPRYKRRKVAIFFAYCGVGYQGMQKNPGAKTIESDLEEALFLAGAVPEQDHGHPKRFDWARSARTDKGVSAVGQVVSGRFYIDPPGFVDRLNSKLNPQIRIFGFKRVTASFNAKKFCDRRRYVYLIPVFALDPSSHRDRESVLASLGSGNELVKCLECSDRGRKVVGVMGKHVFRSQNDGVELDISSNTQSATGVTDEIQLDISSNTQSATVVTNEIRLDISSNTQSATGVTDEIQLDISSNTQTATNVTLENGANGATHVEIDTLHSEKIGDEETKPVKPSEFRYGEKERERFNRILKQYEGTHNFHNFTTRIKAEDPSARRYIISFEANTIVTVDGMDFVKCEVVGQSFMLHQIRKLIGMAVAIMRNCTPESLLQTALQQNVNITVPTAPEVGLYLEECYFTSYNQKWKDTHEEVSMTAYAEDAEEFKMKHIYSHIASTEHKEGVVGLWLHSLNHRNYPDLRVVSNDETSDVGSAKLVGSNDETSNVGSAELVVCNNETSNGGSAASTNETSNGGSVELVVCNNETSNGGSAELVVCNDEASDVGSAKLVVSNGETSNVGSADLVVCNDETSNAGSAKLEDTAE